MVRIHPGFGATALVFLSPMLVASPPGAGDDDPPQESLPIARPLPGGTFSRSCVGDFDGNEEPDIALLTSSGIEIVVDPGSVFWWLQTTTGANDLSARPRPVGQTLDKFVAVGASGAALHWISSNQLNTTAIQGGPWLGALLVDSALTDVGSSVIEERIVGVMSDGVSLKTLRLNGSEWLSANITLGTALPGDPSTVQIVELELVDIDGDQAVELALGVEDADDCGVAFYELDGTPITPWYGYADRTLTSLTAGAQANGNTYCAWTTKNQSGAEHVYACDSAGPATYLAIGSAGVVGAGTAQWSNDGHADLVLALSNGDLRVLTNLGTTAPSFAWTHYTAIAADSVQTANAAEPAVGDFDFDGDDDLALALETSEELEFHRSWRVDHLTTQAPVLETVLEDSTVSSAAMAAHPGCGANPNAFMTHTIAVSRGGNSAATHIAYKVWRRGSLGSNTNPNPDTGTIELEPDGTAFVVMHLKFPLNQGCGVPGVDSVVLYYYELQLVRWTETELIRYSPTFYGVETDSSSSANADHLASIRYQGSTAMEVYFGDTPPLSGDPVVVGSLDQIRYVPGFAGGTAPQ